MLTSMEVQSNQGALLSLPLEDLVDGFLLDSIDGLDPVKATITSSSFAQLDGSQYQSSRREERNIIVTITLAPDWGVDTVRDLRKRLYAYFMPKSWVQLKFYSTDMNPVQIQGRVESFETEMFAAEPVVTVSILCGDPDFVDPVPVVFAGNTTSTTTETLIEYDGSVESGFLFTLNVNRVLNNFTIYHRDPAGNLRQLDFAGTLANLDVLRISTVAGDKYGRLTRGGTETSYLYGIDAASTWLELQPGENYLRVYATGANVPFTISYLRKHGGL